MKYVGSRYVPKFIDDPHDPNLPYEVFSVVDGGMGVSYIAGIPVPANQNIPLTDTTYWHIYGTTNGAIINLQNQIGDLSTLKTVDISSLTAAINSIFDNSVFANIKDYGAVGDGVTDDRAAIVAAYNTGKPIYIPEGTYRVSAPITIDKPIYVQGAGVGLTLLKFDAQANVQKYVFSNYSGSYHGACFKDFSIDVNNYALSPTMFHGGIYLANFTDVLIDNIEVYHTSEGGNGITLEGCKCATISNCYFHDIYGDGIYCQVNCERIAILNNRITKCTVNSGCIDCWQSSDIVCMGNSVSSNDTTTFGFNIDSCSNMIIANNECTDSYTGISTFASHEITIANNRCRGMVYAGIEIQHGLNNETNYMNLVIGNDCTYPGQFGIIDSGKGQFNSFINNHVRYAGRHGIYVTETNFAQIKGNQVTYSSQETANTFADIAIGASMQYVSIDDNVCMSPNAGTNILCPSTAGNLSVRNNDCDAVGGTYNITVTSSGSLVIGQNRGTVTP